MVKRRSALVLTTLWLSSVGLPCCLAYDPSTPMKLVGENAIIVWDADRKIEHFIRQADFEGKADNFGFIVPTPTLPKVAEASEESFRVFLEIKSRLDSERFDGAAASSETAGSVEVIDQYQVGDFAVSILKATDGASMNAWLKKNGYASRPAMTDWLDYYAKMSWHFAALKLIRAKDAKTPKTKAVRVTFKTDVPFYPYKMPEDTWPADHYRPLNLYFVGYGLARGQYRGDSSNWEAEVDWSAEMNETERRKLANTLGLTTNDIPPGATVTAFLNTELADDYSQDIFFLTYSTIVPTWLLATIVVGFLAFLIAAIRKRRASMLQSVELVEPEK